MGATDVCVPKTARAERSFVVVAAGAAVAVLAVIAGALVAAAVTAGTAVVSWFLPRSACCVGQDVRVAY